MQGARDLAYTRGCMQYNTFQYWKFSTFINVIAIPHSEEDGGCDLCSVVGFQQGEFLDDVLWCDLVVCQLVVHICDRVCSRRCIFIFNNRLVNWVLQRRKIPVHILICFSVRQSRELRKSFRQDSQPFRHFRSQGDQACSRGL